MSDVSGASVEFPRFVAQTPDSELCFAACVAAVTASSLGTVSEALMKSFVSEEDGNTAALFETTHVPLDGHDIVLTPVPGLDYETNFDERGMLSLTPEAAMDALMKALQPTLVGRVPMPSAIALLHNKSTGGGAESHWLLIANNHVMDPLRDGVRPLTLANSSETDTDSLASIVRRSVGSVGLFGVKIRIMTD